MLGMKGIKKATRLKKDELLVAALGTALAREGKIAIAEEDEEHCCDIGVKHHKNPGRGDRPAKYGGAGFSIPAYPAGPESCQSRFARFARFRPKDYLADTDVVGSGPPHIHPP